MYDCRELPLVYKLEYQTIILCSLLRSGFSDRNAEWVLGIHTHEPHKMSKFMGLLEYRLIE